MALEFHDIAPPVDYSLIPPWLLFLVSCVTLLLLGAAFWYTRGYFHKKPAQPSPREYALDALDRISGQIERTAPYEFSIRVSDILRSYVVEQFGLPMTRQTSMEFLNSIAGAENFSAAEKQLLADFLNRCDLIKFARYEATTNDNRSLLEEARAFVKGEALVPV